MVELYNPKHDKALLLLENIKKTPGKSLTELSDISGLTKSQSCEYLKELERIGWIDISQVNQKNLHIITNQGRLGIYLLKFINGTLECIEEI